jgi:hypothetical protein
MRSLCSDASFSHFTFSEAERLRNASDLTVRYNTRFSSLVWEDESDMSLRCLMASRICVFWSFAKSCSAFVERGLLVATCVGRHGTETVECLFAWFV